MFLFLAAAVLQSAPLSHPSAASEDATDHQAICDGHSVGVRYANSRTRVGSVESVRIDGREISGAAAELTRRIGERDVEKISFLTCPADSDGFKIGAVMETGEAASARARMKSVIFFKITRDGLIFSDPR